MKNNTKEILLYDRDNVFLLGVSDILKRLPLITGVDCYNDSQTLWDTLHEHDYDLYIIEIDSRHPETIGFLEKIISEKEGAKILIQTFCEEESLRKSLKDIKVDGVLNKRADIQEMENAVRKLLHDENYCSPHYDRMKASLNRNGSKEMLRDDSPTKRELEVLRAMASGDSSGQIAQKLGISENTVESFRKKLIQKFDARNAIDLVVKAIRDGWLDVN